MVFAQELPYLVSVESKGEEEQSGFWQETQISYETLVQKLAPLVQETLTPQAVRQTLAIASYTESGRVKAVRVGGEEIDAVDFRHAVGLRSTWFSITLDENGVTFLQRGYGHGVGMSQAGANSMAASGENYRAILAHYYPGTLLEIP